MRANGNTMSSSSDSIMRANIDAIFPSSTFRSAVRIGRETKDRHLGKLPISTFNGSHPEREIIAFNHHRSFAIPLPPDIFSSLSFLVPSHRLERPVERREHKAQQRTPFLLPQRFGVNRNRISRERRLEAIREVFTPSCEGTSTGGMTIEGRKGHGSRNLSSVAQHCCHGCFALSQRIDGGAECCWVDDHYFSMCV